MICSHSYCIDTDNNDKMIACWICKQIYHTKCLYIPTHVADDLNGNLGLRWCCNNCKDFDIDFFKFVKTNRDKFNELKQEFTVLSSMFIKYEEIFDKYKSLNNKSQLLNGCSPKRKRTSKRLTSKSNSNFLKIAEPINQNLAINNLISAPESPVIPMIQPNSTNQTLNTNLSNPIQITSQNSSHQSVNNLNNYAPEITTQVVNDNLSMSMHDNNIEDIISVQKQSTRSIFVARLSSDTTTDDVSQYINSKLDRKYKIKIFKFNYAEPRSKASFKVTVPEEIFNKVIAPHFWPANTITREYKEKPKKDIAFLPKSSLPNSKN